MKHLSPHRPALDIVARHASALCCVLAVISVAVTRDAAFAQTSNTPDPKPAPAESSATQDGMPPPGGCKPIGLTVSGEVVFPLECKEFIERQKAMNQRPPGPEPKSEIPEPKSAAAEAKPVAGEAKPAVTDDKSAAVEDKPAVVKDPSETADAKPAAAEPKPAAAEPKPAVADTKPAVAEPTPGEAKPAPAEEKTAAKPSDDTAPEDSQTASQPVGSVPLPRRGERKPREHVASGAPGCTRYRTYDAAAGTYRGFDGRTRPCR
jgi:hypothetical protein